MKRTPVVAGMFYPLAEKELRETVSGLLDRSEGQQRYRIVISPHAGYPYSGSTAAKAIHSLKPAGVFIILGPNHNMIGSEFALDESEAWETPLGNVSVDGDISSELLECDFLEKDGSAHSHEHSIEVQLPFLQERFGDFRFVPVSIAGIGYSGDFLGRCGKLGEYLAGTIKGKKVSVIASSDFSHYLPRATAEEKDVKAIERIKAMDTKGFFNVLEETNGSVCGYGPIAVVMETAKALGLKRAEVIDHTDSGDSTGDTSQVVSYYAIGFR